MFCKLISIHDNVIHDIVIYGIQLQCYSCNCFTVVCQIGHYIVCWITKPFIVLRQRSTLYAISDNYHREIHYIYILSSFCNIKVVSIYDNYTAPRILVREINISQL